MNAPGPNDENVVEIFTDGACSGNPGPGGWGALLVYKGHERSLSGGEPATTNNRMELMAAIQALEALKRGARVRLYTDSMYLRDGITRWIHNWKVKGWKTADRKPVKNAELWRRLDAALPRHEIEWHWVRGHAGHEGNERADALARAGMARFLKGGEKAAAPRPAPLMQAEKAGTRAKRGKRQP